MTPTPTTQDKLEELAVTLCDKLMKAVNTFTPEGYSRNDPKSPISQAIPDLIKEKHRLRQLYNNTQDPNIKSTINKLQKELRTKINQESTIRLQLHQPRIRSKKIMASDNKFPKTQRPP